jgi:hypothetical protein
VGEIFLQILQELENEAHDFTAAPPEDWRTEFGFGRVNGVLYAVNKARNLLHDRMREIEAGQHQQEKEFE